MGVGRALAAGAEHRVDAGGSTTSTFEAGRRSNSTMSFFDEFDSVTILDRRYTSGATRRSTVSPSVAAHGASSPSTIFHISAWTWCSRMIPGPRFHSGEKNGMPFQISTSASRGPWRPINSDPAARGNTR